MTRRQACGYMKKAKKAFLCQKTRVLLQKNSSNKVIIGRDRKRPKDMAALTCDFVILEMDMEMEAEDHTHRSS